MKFEAVTINKEPGAVVVKSSDGTVGFDSRLPMQRLYLTGTADVTGPPNQSITATTLLVPFGKTFPKTPYIRSAARLIDAVSGNPGLPQYQNFWPPSMGWSQITVTGQQFFFGNYTAANESGVYLGNAMQSGAPRGRLRFIYVVFENPIEE